MRRIVLDSNVIITDPSTGSFTFPDSKFVVPAEVASELLAAPPGTTSSYFSLVSKMVNSGNTEVVSSQQTTPTFEWSPDQPGIHLSQVDQAVLAVASETKQAHPQDEVVIASNDLHIQLAGSRMGLKVLSSTELAGLLHGGNQDPTVKEQAKKVRSYELKHIVWSVLCSALATAGIILVVQNIQAILSTAHIWATVIFLPFAGITLFWVRARQRLGYGITEFFMGLLAALSIFMPNFHLPEVAVSALVQLAGGLYLMVRGLENIGLGLRWYCNGSPLAKVVSTRMSPFG